MPTAQTASGDEQKQKTLDNFAPINEQIFAPIPGTVPGMFAPHIWATPTVLEPL
jgi:hypothetical protein